jgi:hypothetical protein
MNLRRTRLAAALSLSLVAAGCFNPPPPNSNGGENVNLAPPTPATTEVKIKSPSDNGTVEQTEVVRGTSQNVPVSQKIWVVIFISKTGRYYPQNDAATVQPSGNWNSVTYFGVPSDKGLKFELLAVTADANAQNDFKTYLTAARDKSTYAGLAQLPAGATEQHRVTVTRK